MPPPRRTLAVLRGCPQAQALAALRSKMELLCLPSEPCLLYICASCYKGSLVTYSRKHLSASDADWKRQLTVAIVLLRYLILYKHLSLPLRLQYPQSIISLKTSISYGLMVLRFLHACCNWHGLHAWQDGADVYLVITISCSAFFTVVLATHSRLDTPASPLFWSMIVYSKFSYFAAYV